MRKLLVYCCFFILIVSSSTYAQAIAQKFGNNPTMISASAVVEVESTNKGILIPRVTLTGTTDATTIVAPATSLLVYNTATAGTSPNEVSPGYYYWTGTAWTRFINGTPSADWKLTGNAGTTAGTNFIGTTDAVDLVAKTNNAEVMRITSSGKVGIGTTTPAKLLDVAADALVNGLTIGKGGSAVVSNTALGDNALSKNTTGGFNTATGAYTLFNNTTGSVNEAIGYGALYSNTTGSYNIAMGTYSFFNNTTGSNNVGIGYRSLFANGDGNNNTGVGMRTLSANTSGIDNTAIGLQALFANTVGSRNTAMGVAALISSNTGNYNTSFGASSLSHITTGSTNTALGYGTGLGITTGNANTIIGSNVAGLASGLSNNIIIADGDGNRRINVNHLGYVGVGTSTQVSKLEISGAIGLPMTTVSSNTSLTENNAIVRVNTTAGHVTLTLPNASTATNRMYTLIKTDLTANKIIFSSPIQGNGFSFSEANVPGEYKIQSDGTNWVYIQ